MNVTDKSNNQQDRDDGPEASTSEKTAENEPISESAFNRQLPVATQEFMKSRLIAANFGNIVTVLMQSSDHKDRKISELRDIVVPALLNNQFRVSEAHKKGSGYTIPVGIILWARVSEDVDKRLSTLTDEEIQLTAPDWIGGDNIWIIEVVGEQRFIAALLKDLRQKEFKDKKVKYRSKTKKGVEIKVIP